MTWKLVSIYYCTYNHYCVRQNDLTMIYFLCNPGSIIRTALLEQTRLLLEIVNKLIIKGKKLDGFMSSVYLSSTIFHLSFVTILYLWLIRPIELIYLIANPYPESVIPTCTLHMWRDKKKSFVFNLDTPSSSPKSDSLTSPKWACTFLQKKFNFQLQLF